MMLTVWPRPQQSMASSREWPTIETTFILERLQVADTGLRSAGAQGVTPVLAADIHRLAGRENGGARHAPNRVRLKPSEELLGRRGHRAADRTREPPIAHIRHCAT
jgi:hypothetical protein